MHMHTNTCMTLPNFDQDCVMHNLRCAAREVSRRYDKLLRPFGVTGGQFTTLAVLSHKPGLTVGELSQAQAMDRTTTSRNVRVMVQAGLVRSSADKDDARTRRLRLTAKGQRCFDDALPAWRQAQMESARRLGDVRWDDLRDSIRHL